MKTTVNLITFIYEKKKILFEIFFKKTISSLSLFFPLIRFHLIVSKCYLMFNYVNVISSHSDLKCFRKLLISEPRRYGKEAWKILVPRATFCLMHKTEMLTTLKQLNDVFSCL